MLQYKNVRSFRNVNRYNVNMDRIVYLIILGHIGGVFSANLTYMEQTLRQRFADTRHHQVNAAYKAAAREFLYNEFKRFGLETEYQHFQYYFGNPQQGSYNFTNVIGVLKGEHFGKSSDKILGVVAHYDTVDTTKGVDDNGAGLVAMLDVVKTLSTRTNIARNNTIIFLAPDLEEYNLIGSRQFVLNWLLPWLQRNYEDNALGVVPYGAIVLDTVMEYNTSKRSQLVPQELYAAQEYFNTTINSIASDQFEGDFLTLIYRQNADFPLADSFSRHWKKGDRPQFEVELFALPFDNLTVQLGSMFGNFLRSDHTNFWLANIPAVFLTDTANFRGDMINCYHSPCDNLEVMLTSENMAFLGKTADTIRQTVEDLAESHTVISYANIHIYSLGWMSTAVLLCIFIKLV